MLSKLHVSRDERVNIHDNARLPPAVFFDALRVKV